MYFVSIIVLATIYCFLDDREMEVIKEYNNPFDPQTYIIKCKKSK